MDLEGRKTLLFSLSLILVLTISLNAYAQWLQVVNVIEAHLTAINSWHVYVALAIVARSSDRLVPSIIKIKDTLFKDKMEWIKATNNTTGNNNLIFYIQY